MKRLVHFCMLAIVLMGCRNKEYDYDFLMDKALEIKKSDKTPNPVFDGELEPSMPDKKLLHSTVLGIDINNNGIRDDIDIYINRSGKNFNERMAMRQFAQSQQAFLKAAFEKRYSDAEPLMNVSLTAANCLDVIFPSDPDRLASRKIFHQLGVLTGYPAPLRGQLIVGFYKNIIVYGAGGHTGVETYKNCNFTIEHQEAIIKRFIDLSKTR